MVSLSSILSQAVLLALYIGDHPVSTLSFDTSSAEVAAPRPEVEVEFDLDPESKAQWGGYAASRSDRPVLDGRSTFPDGEPMGINIRPVGGRKLESDEVPISTVLKPEGFNFGRGVTYVTLKEVQKGEELLSLPMNKVMSVTSAAKGRVGLLLEANPDLPPSIALGLHLLEEKSLGAASNFSDFVATLPTAINSTLFYSESEMDELKGTQLLRYTMGRLQAVETFYDALLKPLTSREAVDPPIFKEEVFTLGNFRWAMGVVWASAFPVGEHEEEVVLAPILDTIGICTDLDDEGNETCPSNHIEVDTSTQRLVVYASSPFQKDQEIRLSMPNKSSAQFMLNNGFARDRASQKLDKIDLTVTLDPSDALAPLKSYLIETQLNESVNASYALFYGNSKIDQAISTSLKMKLLSGAELSRYKELLTPKEETDEEEDRQILSLRNEFVFTRAIMSTCTTLLEQYPTSVEQDLSTLANLADEEDLESTRKSHVQQILIMEKQILKQTMDIALEDWKELVFSSHPNLKEV